MSNLYNDLSIGELSKRTGVGVSTLRAWERRYGFPKPARIAGGHRRYGELDVAAVAEVVRVRKTGASLGEVIQRVRAAAEAPQRSIFAALRTALPTVEPLLLSKAAMLALSHAIEDESAVQAEAPVFVGAFQTNRFWSLSRRQWRSIASRSELTVALAAGVPRRSARHLWQVPVAATDPVADEWAVICDAKNFAACAVGAERVTSDGRRFEALWTVEPMAVRAALSSALHLAVASAPGLAEQVPHRVTRRPSLDYTALRHATAVMQRVVGYLDS